MVNLFEFLHNMHLHSFYNSSIHCLYLLKLFNIFCSNRQIFNSLFISSTPTLINTIVHSNFLHPLYLQTKKIKKVLYPLCPFQQHTKFSLFISGVSICLHRFTQQGQPHIHRDDDH